MAPKVAVVPSRNHAIAHNHAVTQSCHRASMVITHSYHHAIMPSPASPACGFDLRHSTQRQQHRSFLPRGAANEWTLSRVGRSMNYTRCDTYVAVQASKYHTNMSQSYNAQWCVCVGVAAHSSEY